MHILYLKQAPLVSCKPSFYLLGWYPQLYPFTGSSNACLIIFYVSFLNTCYTSSLINLNLHFHIPCHYCFILTLSFLSVLQSYPASLFSISNLLLSFSIISLITIGWSLTLFIPSTLWFHFWDRIISTLFFFLDFPRYMSLQPPPSSLAVFPAHLVSWTHITSILLLCISLNSSLPLPVIEAMSHVANLYTFFPFQLPDSISGFQELSLPYPLSSVFPAFFLS